VATDNDELGPAESSPWVVAWYVLLALIMLGLLAGHVFFPRRIRVDTPTIGLLILLVLLPLVDRIEVLKGGGVEARLRAARREARRVRARADALPAPEREPVERVRTEEELLRQLDDPSKLLALDRLELERSLLSLAERRDIPLQQRPNIRMLARQLAARGVIGQETLSLIDDVLPLLNQAVHGYEVDWDLALLVHDAAVKLRSYLDSLQQPS
jgi:hypothetical protein